MGSARDSKMKSPFGGEFLYLLLDPGKPIEPCAE